jgi:hypothetical protein
VHIRFVKTSARIIVVKEQSFFFFLFIWQSTAAATAEPESPLEGNTCTSSCGKLLGTPPFVRIPSVERLQAAHKWINNVLLLE